MSSSQSEHTPHARPPGEEEELKRIWATPKGLRAITAVNNNVVGLLYLGAAFLFFILAGILALLMRTQLATSDNTFLSQELYNQIFTVHGTTMMFLFAVPAVEALGVLLLPQMLAARDLPFPRLSAFAVWAYIVGGLVFFSTVFYGMAPSGGWFMYPPLTSSQYSPSNNADFWLLGIGFIEISAIAGAIEIIVGTLRTRPPGMSLDKMPIFAWSMLIFAGMIVFAFPAVILATLLLEFERAFGWPFFIAERGGDALLWQHLFWFFGHPEVYIIFLPAAGLVSMIVPAMARTPLIGYHLIVVALIATGFFSFGLWVHHMFATGIPALSLTFFSAASMAVAIPSGIQVFSWIATFASAPDRVKITTATLFIFGFLFIFVLGGLTGVMVAMVPFDWQVHDTYFIVAHLHYVLIGGMVFPLFATFYYWAPMVSKTPLSERLGRWVFGLMFVGFNTAFFPMHISGLYGMPRRVWTYPAELQLDTLNLVSTVGAFIFAAGVCLFVIDLIIRFRPGNSKVLNPWKAGTLEWLPNDVYCTRTIPHVTSREPLWDQPNLAAEVASGQHYLPNAPTGGRETIVTSAIEAKPDYLLQMPGPGWAHVLAAVFTAGFFLLLTVKLVVAAILSGIAAVVACFFWVWELDPGPSKKVDVGRGVELDTYRSGPSSHSWWAMIVLMLVAASLYLSFMFSYFYLWTVSPDAWPTTIQDSVSILYPVSCAVAFLGASVFIHWASRTLGGGRASAAWSAPVLISVSAVALIVGVGLEVWGHWSNGLRPTESSYGAMVYMASVLTGQLAFTVFVFAIYTNARFFAGKLNNSRRVTFDNLALLIHFTVAQGLFGLALIHGFPQLLVIPQ